MIKEFNDVPIRETGIINRGMFEQIKKLHSSNPALAGELAISLVELVLTGAYSSDDFTVDLVLTNHKIIADKNADKYDKKVEAKRNEKIEKLKLDKIAEMLAQDMKQKEIAEALGETKQTISYRVNVLRTEFTELLDKYKAALSQKSQISQMYENVNENVNDNNNVKLNFFSPIGETGGVPPAPPQEKTIVRFTYFDKEGI